MNREPVNPDDPQLTAYALGEMTSSERMEFGAKLDNSPVASAELECMEEIMGLLSRSLKSEWCREMNEPDLEMLPDVAEGKVIAPVQFHQPRWIVTAAAAVITAACFVGAAVVTQNGDVGSEVASTDSTGTTSVIVDPMMVTSMGDIVDVPQLFLAEEIDDLSSLDLAESLDDLDSPVDVSYLNADSVVPASHVVPPRQRLSVLSAKTDRVDSYLPSVENGMIRNGMPGGLIERRVRSSVGGVNDPARVIVHGYVSMDGGDSRSQALTGFRPVSMSGNPVLNLEKDLEVIFEFQSIQRDLGALVDSLPQGSDLREKMEALYERNTSALSELKREFVR